MKETLKTMLKISTSLGINLQQVTLLLSKKYKVIIPSKPSDIEALNSLGLMRGAKITDAALSKLSDLEIGKVEKAKADNRPYRFVYDHIKAKILPTKLPTSILGSVDKLMPNETEMRDYFMVFLYLFPSSSRENNKEWSAHFGVPYSGNKLRVISNTAVREFLDITKHYDPDILLLATYRMVLDSIRREESKAYVMKITNFFTEWYERYLETQTLLETKGDQVFTIIDRGISSQDNTILL